MKAIRLIRLYWHIARQMGLGYVLFRAWYEVRRRVGWLRRKFSTRPTQKSWIKLEEWQKVKSGFFFASKEDIAVTRQMHGDLAYRVAQLHKGYFRYFSSEWFQITGWHTHPITGYCYSRDVHWTSITDFTASAGDIKYVWEKSRFTFLYDLVRYDCHFGQDQAAFALRVIEDWIDSNPINCGPNWKCSQEIGLRVLNWTFALHYFRTAPALSQALLDKILCSIYDQICHVDANIRFSKIALKNNHTLTEALGLFATGLLFPFFPESRSWRVNGKELFEEEIDGQIAADGTYVQFSMNYHRVVVQLLTWAIRLGELNRERLSGEVYNKAKASLKFLAACINPECGWLPNYGNNDGALFFPLAESHFRDFRPQLSALSAALGMKSNYHETAREETEWLIGRSFKPIFECGQVPDGALDFPDGGYYLIRDAVTLTFLKCGGCRSRPFQSDQLHLDIWVAGRNILRDAGTWLYNTDEESLRYFSGTRSHNTVMIGHFDQMQKRQRFVLTHWVRNTKGSSGESEEEFWIEAEFEGFRQVGKGIVHRRRVTKKKGGLTWQIQDHVLNAPKGMHIYQRWHPDETFRQNFTITAWDERGAELSTRVEEGWYSEIYGKKVASEVWVFGTPGNSVTTIIESVM